MSCGKLTLDEMVELLRVVTDNARYRFLPGTTAERVIQQAWEYEITKRAKMRAWLLCVVAGECVERGSTLPGLKKRVPHLDCRRLPKRFRVPQVVRNSLEAWQEILYGDDNLTKFLKLCGF